MQKDKISILVPPRFEKSVKHYIAKFDIEFISIKTELGTDYQVDNINSDQLISLLSYYVIQALYVFKDGYSIKHLTIIDMWE